MPACDPRNLVDGRCCQDEGDDRDRVRCEPYRRLEVGGSGDSAAGGEDSNVGGLPMLCGRETKSVITWTGIAESGLQNGYCTGLENRRPQGTWGFESLTLRR